MEEKGIECGVTRVKGRTFQKEGMAGVVKYVLSNVDWTETTGRPLGFGRKSLLLLGKSSFSEVVRGECRWWWVRSRA